MAFLANNSVLDRSDLRLLWCTRSIQITWFVVDFNFSWLMREYIFSSVAWSASRCRHGEIRWHWGLQCPGYSNGNVDKVIPPFSLVLFLYGANFIIVTRFNRPIQRWFVPTQLAVLSPWSLWDFSQNASRNRFSIIFDERFWRGEQIVWTS